jgi:hypothetical protein
MSNENDALRKYFAENPRMMGVAFTMALLLLEAGNAAAAVGGVNSGP